LSIPDPGSRIPGPKKATKEKGDKKLLSYHFLYLAFHKKKLVHMEKITRQADKFQFHKRKQKPLIKALFLLIYATFEQKKIAIFFNY
jgi:hypothetical protein